MNSGRQDVFISHAAADKSRHIVPLCEALARHNVTFWLDSNEIRWGDSIVAKINAGLRESQYALVCLSAHFLRRPWPEAELAAVLAMQNADGLKRVLPLLLDSKEQILAHYPLLADIAYREVASGCDLIAQELAGLCGSPAVVPRGQLHVVVEGVHTGALCNLVVPERASFRLLVDRAQSGLGLETSLQAGPFTQFLIRWVLVDVDAEAQWKAMKKRARSSLYALVQTEKGLFEVFDDSDRLADVGVRNHSVFHLYAVADDRQDNVAAEEAEPLY
jgi:hypothetical protein